MERLLAHSFGQHVGSNSKCRSRPDFCNLFVIFVRYTKAVDGAHFPVGELHYIRVKNLL